MPVIVISSGGAEERDRATRLGANFFLQKPVKYQDIVSTVRALLAAGTQPGVPAPLKGAKAAKPADLSGAPAPAALDTAREKEQHSN
jgi:FixJ family two-component response regulator